MALPVFFISSLTLEQWDHQTPWTTGIGGSETSHIEMSQRLSFKGYNVISYAPVAKPSKKGNVRWLPVDTFLTSKDAKKKGIFIFYRNPRLLDGAKPKGQQWWFVAQDVDYDGQWTPEALANVDRYICLCKDHASFTESKYPALRNKIYISSNGIRSSYIRAIPNNPRNFNRMFFPSSPDRGVKLLLENWFRIREINPKAELRVAYGFNNMEAIVKLMGPQDWRADYQKELEALLKQPGITFTGRLNQGKIYQEWSQTGVWAHPTDFPETSCITCMEAQALGAWPVTNKLWALKDNVAYGYMVEGIPQKSDLVRSNWLQALGKAFHNHDERLRKEMREWALENHDWEKVVTQWSNWIEEDSKK